MLLKLGQYEEALAVLDKAVHISDDSENHLLRGRALEGLKRSEEAFEAYENALIADPGNQEALRRIQSPTASPEPVVIRKRETTPLPEDTSI